jgi:hypothetical protein
MLNSKPHRVRVPVCLDINMRRRAFLSQAGYWVAGTSVATVSGCGTLLHPGRRHRSHSGRIDWTIAALDGCGLLLYFVPGVVAFAVDFYTGAIYLPRGHYSRNDSHKNPGSDTKLQKIAVPQDQLDEKKIEQVVSEYVGDPISLIDTNARFSPLSSLEDFSDQTRRHHQDPMHGHSYCLLSENASHMI